MGFLTPGRGTVQGAGDVPRKVALYDGEVVLRAPEGYCIDRPSMRQDGRAGFVLVASCETLSGLRGQAVVEPVLITVSVLPEVPANGRPTPAEMARDLAPAEVLTSLDAGGLTLVRLSAGGDRILPGGDPRHWRGSMVVNGYLIGLALYAREGSPMAGREGRDLLTGMARRIRRASPDRPAALATRAGTPGPWPVVAGM